MQEVQNIIRILRESKNAFQENNPYKLKNLSNETIHSATIYQDPDNVIVAVIVYALSKITERDGYKRMDSWNFFSKLIEKKFSEAISSLEKKDFEKFRLSMGNIRNSINKLDDNLSIYIKDIFYKAEINKAFKIYEHGISAEQTATLLGVSLWDLASYIGQSSVSESHFNEAVPIKERIKIAENLKNYKNVILDAGPLISLTLNGLLHVLEKFKEKFPQIHFILTPQVKKEIVDKALTIKKYQLEAVKILYLLETNVLEMADKFVDLKSLQNETIKVMNVANSCFKADGEKLKLIQEGEASCLAFANLCNCENLIIADERTVRLLTESPENLKSISERRLHTSITYNRKELKYFSDFKFIRSSELLFVAYKNNLFDYKKNLLLLDALLYSVKFSGTSISSKEIEEMKNLV